MKNIDGGICAATGFTAAGTHCGIRKSRTKNDIALIFSEKRAAAASVYTQNLVKGAPIAVTKKNISDGYAQAVIVNSGNANTCNSNGVYIAEETCRLTGEALGIPAEDIVVASTGVIGQQMFIDPFVKGIPELVKLLSKDGCDAATEGIMTTDTVRKQAAVETEISGKKVTVGGIAKGSGMIHPNMATMLVFITSDCAISPKMLQKALSAIVKRTFNMISVDGDTSTNDMCTVLANGMAGNEYIDVEGRDYDAFYEALYKVMEDLSRKIASDGEGASRLIECVVKGARDYDTCAVAAKAVIGSSLVKAAMFGADANWGRVLCALGYSGADLDITKISVAFESPAGHIDVCEGGFGVDFSEELAKKILTEKEILILVKAGDTDAEARAFGCDLTYDYVKINGDYRT
ncbi:MAG: bifunctional glutamate N-acetyltransferase/amino-acid acetyltransferase ArgJ [Clostridia bacterium]|nr:bifunctional glutamate N-acetyltransferase/amino-acid acetyltransferase ArgJ [Clostridia bacterium]